LEGRYSEAIEALNHSIALRPNPGAYNNLGYVYTLMGRFPEAIQALQQALKIDDSDWMNWGNLGDALYWSPNRRGEAAANYRKAISIAASKLQVNSQDVATLAYLANYSAMLGNKEAATEYVHKALKLAPSDGEALYRAAIVYNHFNDSEQALTYIRKALQAGYSRSVIRDTPDFARLRDDQRFRALISNP
jgi:tetratricopeptide (TPR) repeat protein